MNWGKIRWKLVHYFPHDPRFSRSAFSKCPTWIIEEALAEGSQIFLEEAGLQSAAAANLAVLMAQVNGAKHPKAKWFNEPQALLFQQKAIAEIEPETAQSFMRLYKLGKVPEWLVEQVDLEVMRASAGSLGGAND